MTAAPPGPVPGKSLRAVVCVPGIDIGDAVESKTLVALGSRDPRYQERRANEPGLGAFLDRFGTMFGERVTPTLIARFDPGSRPTAEEVIGFRNAIALPVLLKAWADLSRSRQNTGALFAEYFEIHPAMPSSDGQSVVVNAEAYRDLRFGLGGFHGQAPAAVDPRHVKGTADPSLRDALVALLDAKVSGDEPSRFRQRALNSVKFAMRAMRAPSMSLSDASDWAAMVSMWVSALEALSNPGGEGKVSFSHVAERIKATPWLSPELHKRRHKSVDEKFKELTTLPVQIYGRIYKLRNDCLHGVRHFGEGGIESEREASWGLLQIQAPVLYRSVLLAALTKAGFGRDWTDENDPLAAWRQREFEEPLLRPGASTEE